MRRVVLTLLAGILVLLPLSSPAGADGADKDGTATGGGAETITDAVRVTLIRMGGVLSVGSVTGGSSGGGGQPLCDYSVVIADELDEATYGLSPGPQPHPDAQIGLLLCNGSVIRAIWIAPDDIIDLDALAQAEAQRYIEDVLVPDVTIGVNPGTQGLVGLPSWFWIDGFTGSATAPPISAFGMTIDVRMSSGSVAWDFGDGGSLVGDLGRAYPAESTVQHIHQHDGTVTITAAIDLVPEYRVNGGPWLTLPDLVATATVDHTIQERQAVIVET